MPPLQPSPPSPMSLQPSTCCPDLLWPPPMQQPSLMNPTTHTLIPESAHLAPPLQTLQLTIPTSHMQAAQTGQHRAAMMCLISRGPLVWLETWVRGKRARAAPFPAWTLGLHATGATTTPQQLGPLRGWANVPPHMPQWQAPYRKCTLPLRKYWMLGRISLKVVLHGAAAAGKGKQQMAMLAGGMQQARLTAATGMEVAGAAERLQLYAAAVTGMEQTLEGHQTELRRGDRAGKTAGAMRTGV